MNVPSNLNYAPLLEDFPCQTTDNIRYADLDTNGHVNNAAYVIYFETGRAVLHRDPSIGLRLPGRMWALVRLDIHFRAETHFPGSVQIALAVSKIGRTSVTYDQAIFSNGLCVASAQSVSVMMDQETRKSVPIPEEIIAAFKRWARRGIDLG